MSKIVLIYPYNFAFEGLYCQKSSFGLLLMVKISGLSRLSKYSSTNAVSPPVPSPGSGSGVKGLGVIGSG